MRYAKPAVTEPSESAESLQRFSLIGGPLHRLASRLGLVRNGTNTIKAGFAISLPLWLVLVALAILQGAGSQVYSLATIGSHLRLLVIIPLFYLCETWLDPRMAEFVRNIVASGVVPERSLSGLASLVSSTIRKKDSWLPDSLCLLVAVLLVFGGLHSRLPHLVTSHPDLTATGLAGLWNTIVCLTVFRFLLLRWLYRILLWSWFLLRVAKLELNLVPTHPDGVAGLGYLEVVHMYFIPLALSISSIQAALIAREISSGAMPFDATYPAMALVIGINILLFVGPMFVFAPKLWASRVKGLNEYMQLASNYVTRFDRKWLGRHGEPKEELLGTADLQSLADLGNSVRIVRDMRWVPVSLRLLLGLSLAGLLPMLPLFLFKYPIAELIQRFMERLTGL